MNLIDIVKRAKLNEKDLIAVYLYGSRIYYTATKTSDYDFIVITNNKTTNQFSDTLININFYTLDEHQKRLDGHEISAIECLFLSSDEILLETIKFTFNLNLKKLRHSLSTKSSNSFVKAKKKLTIEKDYDLNLGRKSLFHSFRIIDFGIQIATYGKIIDYTSSNALFYEIMSKYTWRELFDDFKYRYNKQLSDFRKVAPK